MLRKNHCTRGAFTPSVSLEIFGHVRFAILTEVTKQVKS